MAVNILIGIGGTGAKIVESALYLLSAGIGPQDKVVVGLIDQDNSNGNVVRTDELLKLLCQIRRDFETSGNSIDWQASEAEGGTSLFSIPLEPLFGEGEGAHWRPAPDNMPTLRHILRHQDMAEDEQALFNLLFRDDKAGPAETEQTLDLAEGYRGRAHVGAAALISAVNHDQPEFRRKLLDLLKASAGGDEVRIFLAGSLFGGTGAAGFPTIARMVHKLRAPNNENRIKGDRVHLGGVLMLPYFRFGEPDDPAANVITAAELLPQARVAIEFYQNLLHQEGVFDRLYVNGWDKMFDLNYHEAGRGEQRNPALLPELVAALAAIDFFTQPGPIERVEQPFAASRRQGNQMGWTDLPADSPAAKDRLYDRLGGALRFSTWWRYRVEPALDDRSLFSGGVKTPWINKHAKGTNWQEGTPDARKNLADYSKRMLLWASSLQLFSKNKLTDFALWNSDTLRARSDLSKPADPIDLHERRTEEESRLDLNEMLRAADPNHPPANATKVFEDLHSDLASGKSKGLGRLVAGVNRAAKPFR